MSTLLIFEQSLKKITFVRKYTDKLIRKLMHKALLQELLEAQQVWFFCMPLCMP